MLSLGAFLAVVDSGSGMKGSNFVTRQIYSMLSIFKLSENNQLLLLMIICSMLFLTGSIFLIYSAWYSAKLQAEIYVKLQQEIVRKLFNANYEYFVSQNIGYINNAVVYEMNKVSASFKFFATIITSVLLSCVYMIYPLILKPLLPILMVVLCIPLVFVFRLINNKTKYYSIRNTQEGGSMNGITYQILGHFKYLKATSKQDKVMGKLERQSISFNYAVRMLSLWGSISSDGFKPLIIIETFAIIFVMITFFNYNMFEAFVMMALLYAALQKLISIQGSYQKFISSCGGIFIYEKLQKELSDMEEIKHFSGMDIPEFSGPISFQNVTFKYSTQAEPVLRNMSLEIKPNTTVAFVGGSGAGKSTLVNLVCGLLYPQEGAIKISGKDYRTIDIKKLRESIGYVTQEPVIFNDTVANNITLWDKSISDSMQQVSKRASADEFIQQLPLKYETMLGDNGINISGGQRQRITIARELSRNTPILIFDEATSSLDTETERKIQDSIDNTHGEKTILIIAHRLSTVRNSDKIYVLDKGEIIEEGPYDELYDRNGRFRQMVDSQSLN
jgi:subfamily B ATP-binding cassette protein MsbA